MESDSIDNYKFINEKIKNKVEFPKNGDPIVITGIAHPYLLYIRSAKSDDTKEYAKILNLVNVTSKKMKQLKKLPERGDICITNYEDGHYYRVLVINPINDEKIIVFYIDYGNIEEKKFCDMKEATEEICNLKCYVLPFFMKNIPKSLKPIQKLQSTLDSYVDRIDIKLKLIYEDDDLKYNIDGNVEGEIFDITNNFNFNKKILEFSEVKDQSVYKKDIKSKLLPSGSDVKVCVVDNSLMYIGYVSCILNEDLSHLQTLSGLLQEYATNTDEPYKPRYSEMCVVQFDDGEWYRAECLEENDDNDDDSVAVLFIDYGNMESIHISKIRKYPVTLTYFPCFTNYCAIADLPFIINEKLAVRLQELFPMYEELIVSEISSEIICDEINVIKMPNIIKLLKSENLI